MSMNRICPFTRKGMPPLNREKNREQYECLGDECMWYMGHSKMSDPQHVSYGCAVAFGVSASSGSCWHINPKEM